MRRASYRIATGSRDFGLFPLLTSTCACALLYAEPAFAYVDPNVGGLLFQIFAPLFAVIIAFWARINFGCARVLAKLKSFLARIS